MEKYKYSYFPGPTSVPEDILMKGCINYGSADTEPEFVKLYSEVVSDLQKIYNTDDDVVIMSGEGMLILWGAMKSTLSKGDKVLCVSTGLFGSGMSDMAKSIGCDVKLISFPDDCSFEDYDMIEEAIKTFQPKMITAVHCETPSGTLNDLTVLGELKKKYNIPLFYVDAVSSLGAVHVDAKKHNIDLCLGGSQKAFSCPPNSCFTTVSPIAWEIMEKINYAGYDAILPFRNCLETGLFPYTPSWVNLAQLNVSTKAILKEGLDNVESRHKECSKMVISHLKKAGFRIFPKDESYSSPTVTAAYVPDNIGWTDFDKSQREKGIVLGGNYCHLAGKIFRVGHMGSQATIEHMNTLCSLL